MMTTTQSTLINAISHHLGRPIQGWIIVDYNGPAKIWRADDANPVAPERLLNLITDTNCTVDIYVY